MASKFGSSADLVNVQFWEVSEEVIQIYPVTRKGRRNLDDTRAAGQLVRHRATRSGDFVPKRREGAR